MLINFLNRACNNIATSYLKYGDDSVSAIRFLNTAKGYLPRLSYIFHKPEPLGTDFNTVACSVTRYLVLIKIQICKEGTKNINFNLQLGVTESCTKIIIVATNGKFQMDIKMYTRDCFLFDI